MTWFADLTAYEYLQRGEYTPCVNVGWLDGDRAFTRGAVSGKFIERLRGFCRVRVHESREAHVCNLDDCPGLAVDDPMTCELGSAEIRVFARDGSTYAAPDLILHYVRAHEYLPPRDFIDAVLRGPRPTSNKYARLLLAHTPDTYWLEEESIARIGIGRVKEYWWRSYAAARQREREAQSSARRRRAEARYIASMTARYGLGEAPCSMPDCAEQALGGKAFCVRHTPIDADIVVAESRADG